MAVGDPAEGSRSAQATGADAAALGLPVLAQVLLRLEDGVAVLDAGLRVVYANPGACRLLGRPWAQLRGGDFLQGVRGDERAGVRARLLAAGGELAPFGCVLSGPDGVRQEVSCSGFAADVDGDRQLVVVLRPVRAASMGRTARALAQTTAQLVGAGTVEEILDGIARHAVENTAALACGIVVIGEDRKLATAGGYGFPSRDESMNAWTASSIMLDEIPGGASILAGRSVVVPRARAEWEAAPVMRGFAATVEGLDWQCGVYVPLSWEGRVFGVFGAYMPSGAAAPGEDVLAFYTALADQASVAVTNARLAASVERTRLSRELHDSISQALFSMTMHARTAQLAMAREGVADGGALGRSVAQLAELTRGTLAEMRALIFELRPGALAEEGLVVALTKQAAALTAREQLTVTVDGPDQRLNLGAGVEENLYRIASEALNNVVKHARAERAWVQVETGAGVLRIEVGDDGSGFDPDAARSGHIGLSSMAERAAVISAAIAVTSAPGAGTRVTVTLPHEPRRPAEGEHDAHQS